MTALLDRHLEFKVVHLAAGSGFGALGFKLGHARLGRISASFRTLCGVDVDPIACADFERMVGAPCVQMDLFSREQYTAFHGRSPPDGWREATPEDLRRAAGYEFPDVAFWSPPCKGLSSLLNARSAGSAKYVALNELVVRALDLALEAWADNPPGLFLLENVPRIATRGRALLDRVKLSLELAGYVCAETVHDCGELGGLAQHRHRFLLVARHKTKIRPFLYEPDRKPVRGVGEVVGQLPMPDAPLGGSMHRLPRLQWKTWVRLALIEAGSDWRSLNRLTVSGGVVEGLRLAPERGWHAGVLGVHDWSAPAGTITGAPGPTNGAFAVADPRANRPIGRYEPYGVIGWDEVGRTVTGRAAPGAGPYTVADPRPTTGWGGKGKYITAAWDEPTGAVIAGSTTGQGAFTVADPRLPRHDAPPASRPFGDIYRVHQWEEASGTVTSGRGVPSIADPRVGDGRFNDTWKVVRWDEAAGAVTAGGSPSAGGQSIADPRALRSKVEGGDWSGARHYGVLGWDETSPAVTGHASHDNGAHSVADPRNPKEKCNPWIWSLDGTRHRPFTTLEHAALQGYPIEEILGLRMGGSDSQIREHIGNGVPVSAAQSTASTMLQTLLQAAVGQSFSLSAAPIWVDRRLALGLTVEAP
jgi:site-specific DNA-cytosine methylase